MILQLIELPLETWKARECKKGTRVIRGSPGFPFNHSTLSAIRHAERHRLFN